MAERTDESTKRSNMVNKSMVQFVFNFKADSEMALTEN